MNAFEFTTYVENGIIKIPEKYRKNLSKEIKVIVLFDAVQKASRLEKRKSLKKITSLGIPTKGFKFDREEANER
jgi:hypothetical protein